MTSPASPEVWAKLAVARRDVLKALPYFSSGVFAMIPRADDGIETLSVSRGWVFRFNPRFVSACDRETMAFGLAHELFHLLKKHADRAEKLRVEDGKAVLWNLCGDAEINEQLSLVGMKCPSWAFVPETLPTPCKRGGTAEQYFLAQRPAGGGGGGGKDGKKGAPSEGGGKKPGGSGEKPEGPNGDCGGGAGHPHDGEEEEEKKSGGGRTAADAEAITRQVAAEIRASEEKKAGTVPGCLARWASDVGKPPPIPWDRKLARLIRKGVDVAEGMREFGYAYRSRLQSAVGWGPGCPVLPGTESRNPILWVGVDTSGSMSNEDVGVVLSVCRDALARVAAKVSFFACDAELHSLRPVTNWKECRAHIKGGGGTDFRPVFEAAAKARRGQRPDLLVFVTDGHGQAPREPPPFGTIWVLCGEGAVVPAGWGDAVRYPDGEAG